jgi:poly-gamma-glutamate capsule biosynthesis protein CapA/YwtB (metallophosphatase superfamily)
LQTAPASKWCLSVANNHAGDFGEQDYRETLSQIARQGMRAFGDRAAPDLELFPGVVVHSWTEWQNRPSPWVRTSPPQRQERGGQLTIAYPHWGYEYERKPRESQRTPAGYGLIVGHHPHFSQPIERLTDGRVVAWSLGNFVTEVKLASMGEGAILKVGINDDSTIAWARHAQIRLDRSDKRFCRVRILGSEPS